MNHVIFVDKTSRQVKGWKYSREETIWGNTVCIFANIENFEIKDKWNMILVHSQYVYVYVGDKNSKLVVGFCETNISVIHFTSLHAKEW